jgi:hypothetical protein
VVGVDVVELFVLEGVELDGEEVVAGVAVAGNAAEKFLSRDTMKAMP